MHERRCNTQAGATTLLAIIKTSHFVQLEVTEIRIHNACRKVCIRYGTWLIANGRRLWHHVCQMIVLPQVCDIM
jgi:hypothetical protein